MGLLKKNCIPTISPKPDASELPVSCFVLIKRSVVVPVVTPDATIQKLLVISLKIVACEVLSSTCPGVLQWHLTGIWWIEDTVGLKSININ